MAFDPAYVWIMIMQPQFIYPIIAFVVGYGAWDRFIRRAFRIHVCMEEGESLREIKIFKKPIKAVGTTIKWIVSKQKGKSLSEEGKAYILDPKDVLYTDRFNKMHIIQPYDEVFGFHPFSDVNGKISFIKLASAKAENLYQTVAKGGFVARTEALRLKLKPVTTMMAIALVGVGLVIGLSFGVSFLPHIAPQFFPPTTTIATHTVANMTITSTGYSTVTLQQVITSTITHLTNSTSTSMTTIISRIPTNSSSISTVTP
jgi:hypothetical protein